MIDYKALNNLKNNSMKKIKDGTYDAFLTDIKYKEVGEYNIPTAEFIFKVGNKNVSKLLFLTTQKGILNKINKSKLDRWLKDITNEYPQYSNRQELSEYLDNLEIGSVPVTLRLNTPICSVFQNFEMEVE